MMHPIYTIGHSTRSLEELIALLHEAGVTMLVDVRSYPSSRRVPQFNRDTLPASLAPAAIGYRLMPALGGRRGKCCGVSHNTWWTHQSFRNYADYAEGAEFRAGLADLIDLSQQQPTAYMCSEAVWWKCHRRIITDYLLAAGIPVMHILAPGHIEPAEINEAAVPHDGALRYACEQVDTPQLELAL